MKELRRKMFWTLFAVMSALGVLMVAFLDYRVYSEKQSDVSRSLVQISSLMEKARSRVARESVDDRSISLDDEITALGQFGVISVFFDPWQSVESVFYVNASPEQISNAVTFAVQETASQNSLMQDDSLLSGQWAWIKTGSQQITLLDLTGMRSELFYDAAISILIFLGYELVAVLVSRKLCQWMVLPIEETFQRQKQFIADASHELKTPIAVILSNAEVMEKDGSIKWLKNIETEAERMNKLVKDLLMLTKSEESKLQLEKINLSFLAEKECLIYEAPVFEKGIVMDTEQITPNLMVRGNQSAVEQVLSIFLDNATEHTRSRIDVAVKPKGNMVELSVSNNGEPISPETQKKIFERFYREDEARNRKKNRYGLGLAIAKNHVERMHGKIGVTSNPRQTTFWVLLPAGNHKAAQDSES